MCVRNSSDATRVVEGREITRIFAEVSFPDHTTHDLGAAGLWQFGCEEQSFRFEVFAALVSTIRADDHNRKRAIALIECLMKNRYLNLILLSAVVDIFAATAMLSACHASRGQTLVHVSTASPQEPSPQLPYPASLPLCSRTMIA